MEMKELKTDRALRNVIPPLTSDEYEELETDILKRGCEQPLDVWEGKDIIIDGHNRYNICTKHKIEFGIREMPFDNKRDVLEYMITKQLARRNLTPAQRVKLELERQKIVVASPRDKFVLSHEKRKEISDKTGVSEGNIQKMKKILDDAPKKTKDAVLSGEKSIHKGYSESMPPKPGPEETTSPASDPEPAHPPKDPEPEPDPKISEKNSAPENVALPDTSLEVRNDNTIFIPKDVCGPGSKVDLYITELVEYAGPAADQSDADVWACPTCNRKHDLSLESNDGLKKCKNCGEARGQTGVKK